MTTTVPSTFRLRLLEIVERAIRERSTELAKIHSRDISAKRKALGIELDIRNPTDKYLEFMATERNRIITADPRVIALINFLNMFKDNSCNDSVLLEKAFELDLL
jgi:hypothetical protein